MAKVGLSQAFYALYSFDDSTGTITYSGGGTLGKAVDAEITMEGGETTFFYANNGPAESAAAFAGGTLTLTNDRLPLGPIADILGLETSAISSPAGTLLAFPTDMAIPYVGYGTVIKMIVDNTVVWRAVLLTKVQFNMPVISGATQEESIEFEGHELTAAILRDDSSRGIWCNWADFASEANAVAWLKAQLSIS